MLAIECRGKFNVFARFRQQVIFRRQKRAFPILEYFYWEDKKGKDSGDASLAGGPFFKVVYLMTTMIESWMSVRGRS